MSTKTIKVIENGTSENLANDLLNEVTGLTFPNLGNIIKTTVSGKQPRLTASVLADFH